MSNFEGPQQIDAESADDAKDRKKKDNKDNKPASDIWTKLSIARTGGLVDAPNQRKNFAEMPVRQLPLEKILKPPEENEDKGDDEEEKSESEKPKAEASERPPEEVFETISSANSAELMDIPHIDHDKPSIPLTAEENKAFTEIASRTEMPHELDDLKIEDTPPIPSWDMATVPEPSRPREEAPPEPVTATTPFWRPSSMSSPFEGSGYSSSVTTGVESATSASSSSSEISSGVTAVVETLKAAAGLAEMMNNPNKLVTSVLTRVALEGFLTQRKQGGSSETLIRKQKEQITELQDRQRQANERLNALFKEQAQEGQDPLVDQNGNRIILQPGQHIERSAGGYSVVVDAHGRPVSEAITYGEAYQHEQQREQLSDDVFAKVGGAGGPSGATQDSSGLGGLGAPFPPLTGQSQTGSQGQYGLPGQPNGLDYNHRLPEPRNNLKNVAASPWLWTAVAILIIIYFLAALA